MLTFIIIAIIAASGLILLISSVRVRLRFNETEKNLAVSYTILMMLFNFEKMTGQIKLAGAKLFQFSLKSSGRKRTKEKKKVKKKSRFGLSDLKIKYLKMAGNLIGAISIEEVEIKIRGGFAEPFYTGTMYGYYWAAKGIYPSLMSHVDFQPDFSAGKLKFEGTGQFSLRMYHIIKLALKFAFDRLGEKINRIFIIRKRGTYYVWRKQGIRTP